MNTNQSTQASSSKTPVSSASFNQADAKTQLKKIGDQIEALAKKWESQGATNCEGLYELGNQVEHFLDGATNNFTNESSRESSSFSSPSSSSEDQKDRLS